MCRMAGYLGPELVLSEFLLEPPHNLVVQARQPRELNYTSLNADGYGLGWYAEDGDPALYVCPLPIWSDPNLEHLARSLRSDLWFANVRSATPGMGFGFSNTQPFAADGLLFMHNGFIRDFNERVRPELHTYLDPRIQAEIVGSTDSEFLWALLRHHLGDVDDDTSIETAIGECFELLTDWIGDSAAMLNLMVSDGERVYAARHAINDRCPSLYFTTDDERFPEAQLIASERLDEETFWHTVPDHTILILDPEQPPELLSI